MKQLLWLGLLFTSASWLFFIPIFTVSDPKIGIFLILLGVLCNTFSFWKNKPLHIHKKYLIFLIPLLISLLIIGYPYNTGLVVLILGFLLVIVSNQLLHREKVYAAAMGISLTGIILIIQTALFPFYTLFVSHGHRIDIFSPVISFFGGLLGLKTSAAGGIVFVQTFQQTYSITTTWEKLGLFTWLNILIGAVVIFSLIYKKRKVLRGILLFLIASFLYLILRYIMFLCLYTNTLELEIFWNPFYMLLSFLPFAFLLMKLLPLNDGKINIDCFKDFKINKKHIVALVMIFLFIFSTVGIFAFQDPGIKKSGRILVDEYHSDWENTTRPLDKEWYGLDSTYNYYSLAKWLNYYYQVDGNLNDELSLNLLENYDILILKCPTNSYSYEEIWSIKQFVKRGGGLYLIGDHTDVFGMNTFLNQVSEEFGITFNMDATYELGTGEMTVYQPDRLFSHPIMQNVDQFDFMTSCTLAAPLTSENVIIGNRLIGEPGTYATENFFRESVASPESEYGLLLQVAAVKYGKGRVVAFSDSTVFSSFCIFSDGYQSFTLGTIEYLNRANVYSYLNTIFFGIIVISLIISLYLLKNERKIKILFLFLVVGLLSFSTAAPLLSYMNRVNYPLPSAHTEYVQVCFEQEHSNFTVSLKPSISFFAENDNFGTFYVWTQRVGCIPSLEKTLDAAAQKANILVFINPIKSFDKEDIDAVTDFVENGGRILIVDSITNKDSTANDLISGFGMLIHRNTSDYNVDDMIENLTVGNNTSSYLTVTGGEKIVIDQTNNTNIFVVNVSNEITGITGKIVVFVDSYVFSDTVMGGTFNEPDDHQMMLYNTEFYIFGEALLKDI